jgi:PAS domain-containing protein
VTAERNANGGVTQLIAVITDITERKRSEDALRASEERLRFLIDSVKDYAIFTLDTDGRITSWNEGARRR